MPRNNQTGPMGNGPMTGRGTGFCNAAAPADEGRIRTAEDFGRALGRQRGFRRGYRSGNRGFSGRRLSRRRSLDIQGYTPEDTAGVIEMLKMQAESMKDALDSINRRMQELEKSNA